MLILIALLSYVEAILAFDMTLDALKEAAFGGIGVSSIAHDERNAYNLQRILALLRGGNSADWKSWNLWPAAEGRTN